MGSSTYVPYRRTRSLSADVASRQGAQAAKYPNRCFFPFELALFASLSKPRTNGLLNLLKASQHSPSICCHLFSNWRENHSTILMLLGATLVDPRFMELVHRSALSGYI